MQQTEPLASMILRRLQLRLGIPDGYHNGHYLYYHTTSDVQKRPGLYIFYYCCTQLFASQEVIAPKKQKNEASKHPWRGHAASTRRAMWAWNRCVHGDGGEVAQRAMGVIEEAD